MKPFALALLAALAAAPAVAAPLGTTRGTWPAADTREVRVEFPVGQLEIVGTAGNEVVAELSVRCKRGRRCARRAERLALVTDVRDGVRTIELDGWPSFGDEGMKVELRVELPARARVRVEMGVGALVIEDVAADLDAELGVGDANVRVAASAVAKVECRVGVGDASLHSPSGRRESSGLFGRGVRWEAGTGRAHVRLDVGVGDADVWVR